MFPGMVLHLQGQVCLAPVSLFFFFFFLLFKANGSALELVDSHLENVSDSEEFLLYEIVLLCLDGLCSLLVEK